MLRSVRPDQAEVQQEVGQEAKEDVKDLERMKAVGQDAEREEQQGSGKFGKEDEDISLQQTPSLLRRKNGAKRQVTQVDGRQELTWMSEFIRDSLMYGFVVLYDRSHASSNE